MITKDIATKLKHGTELRHVKIKNADGISAARCRVTGVCKTWKTKPEQFQLPVKHGLYDSFYITPDNAADWETVEQAEARAAVVNGKV